jgi:uncharacterized delta-60 repeat protein
LKDLGDGQGGAVVAYLGVFHPARQVDDGYFVLKTFVPLDGGQLLDVHLGSVLADRDVRLFRFAPLGAPRKRQAEQRDANVAGVGASMVPFQFLGDADLPVAARPLVIAIGRHRRLKGRRDTPAGRFGRAAAVRYVPPANPLGNRLSRRAKLSGQTRLAVLAACVQLLNQFALCLGQGGICVLFHLAMITFEYNLTDQFTYGQSGVAGIIQGRAKAAVLTPDGKLVVVGVHIPSTNAQQNDFFVAKLNSDGSFDTSFGGGDGILTTDFANQQDGANSVDLQNDGKIIVSGLTNGGLTGIARYNSDGSLDNTFGQFGRVIINSILMPSTTIKVLSSGKLISLCSSGFLPSQYALMRFNSDGSLDNSFDADGVLSLTNSNTLYLNDMAIQSDGKIVIGGVGSSPFGASDFVVIRHNSDGSLDNSFSSDGIVLTHMGDANDVSTVADDVQDIEIQSDGKILAGGIKKSIPNGDEIIAIARYNSISVGTTNLMPFSRTFSLYPNPILENSFLATFTLLSEDEIKISLFSNDGKVLKQSNIGRLKSGQHQIKVDIPNEISAGNIVVRIDGRHSSICTQIMKIE